MKSRFVLLILLCTPFLLVGCDSTVDRHSASETDSPSNPASLSEKEIEARVGKLACPADRIEIPPGPTGGTFRFNLLETPRSFDPAWIGDTASSFVGTCLHEGLIEFDPIDMSIKPCVATHWGDFRGRDDLHLPPSRRSLLP